MATLVLSNLFLKFLNCFTLIMPLILIYQGDMEQYYDEQAALIERNKQIFLWIIFAVVGLMNALIQYEKVKFEKEKRRELRLKNDLKEKELKDGKDS